MTEILIFVPATFIGLISLALTLTSPRFRTPFMESLKKIESTYNEFTSQKNSCVTECIDLKILKAFIETNAYKIKLQTFVMMYAFILYITLFAGVILHREATGDESYVYMDIASINTVLLFVIWIVSLSLIVYHENRINNYYQKMIDGINRVKNKNHI